MTPYEAWILQGRPIYARLPRAKYNIEDQANPSNWLTRWFDEMLMGLKADLDDLPRQLDATTCDPEWLDFVAALSGFTGQYWDKNWPLSAKRTIAENANEIWANKGSRETLEFLFAAFALQTQIYMTDGFYADVTELDGWLEQGSYFFAVLVPLTYLRESYSFKLVEKLTRLFSPIFCDSIVCYDGWYADFSVCGDLVF